MMKTAIDGWICFCDQNDFPPIFHDLDQDKLLYVCTVERKRHFIFVD